MSPEPTARPPRSRSARPNPTSTVTRAAPADEVDRRPRDPARSGTRGDLSRLARTRSRSSRSLTTEPSVRSAAVRRRGRSRRGSPACAPSRWSRRRRAAWPGPAAAAGAPRRPPCGPARRIRRARAPARSPPRAPASGSRSSGTCSGASARRAAPGSGWTSGSPAAARSAAIVPTSGMLIWKSDSISSRNASNSSSARSTSSISSTARSPALTASSSGRSSRNFGPNSFSTASSSLMSRSDMRPDVQQLAGVVPLVHRLVGVDALVALQPDQLAAEHRGERLGDLGLADARPRPPAGSGAAGTARRTWPWPARGRRGSRRRAASRSARRRSSGSPRGRSP